MTEKVRVNYTDSCPYLKKEVSIEIDYFKIHMAGGRLAPGYKKANYFCKFYEDCTFLDEYGRCPVYIHAPSRP